MASAGAVSIRSAAATNRPRIAILEPDISDAMFGTKRSIMMIFKFLDRGRLDSTLISHVWSRPVDESGALSGSIPGAGVEGKEPSNGVT